MACIKFLLNDALDYEIAVKKHRTRRVDKGLIVTNVFPWSRAAGMFKWDVERQFLRQGLRG